MKFQNASTTEKKELELEKDYGFVFGLNKDDGQTLIYKGDDKWIGTQGDKSQELVCEKTSIKVFNYINGGF